MLADTDRAVIDHERAWWKYPGAKDSAIHDRFGWSPARYYQVLGALLDNPDAIAYDPMTVKRLRRVRDQRRAARKAC